MADTTGSGEQRKDVSFRKPREVNPDDNHVARQQRKLIPSWMKNEVIRNRVNLTYQLYLNRRSPSEIAAQTGVSMHTYYRDLDMAREAIKLGLQEKLEDMALEQVESRKNIIREARAALDELNEVEERTANRARAKADLLRVIAEQEKAIEEMIGIRGGKGSGRSPGRPRFDEGMPPPVAGPTVVIDLRMGTATIEQPAPPIVIENTPIYNPDDGWDDGEDEDDDE